MALVPGTSRSGVTITAGLLLGMTRETASRFSFLLAIPIIVLASAVKLLEVATSDVIVDWSGFLIGGVTSFLMAITAIHFFLKWLNKVGMWPYVIYRIILAGVIYAVLMCARRPAKSLKRRVGAAFPKLCGAMDGGAQASHG